MSKIEIQQKLKNKIAEMMDSAGLSDVRFSESAPYWCAVGVKR